MCESNHGTECSYFTSCRIKTWFVCVRASVDHYTAAKITNTIVGLVEVREWRDLLAVTLPLMSSVESQEQIGGHPGNWVLSCGQFYSVCGARQAFIPGNEGSDSRRRREFLMILHNNCLYVYENMRV